MEEGLINRIGELPVEMRVYISKFYNWNMVFAPAFQIEFRRMIEEKRNDVCYHQQGPFWAMVRSTNWWLGTLKSGNARHFLPGISQVYFMNGYRNLRLADEGMSLLGEMRDLGLYEMMNTFAVLLEYNQEFFKG